MHMKEYPIILNDEELEDFLDILGDAADLSTSVLAPMEETEIQRHEFLLGIITQLRLLKSQNEEDYK